MSACLRSYSYHDESFDFTSVERTNTEITVGLHLFDNANDYRIKNKLEKVSNDRQMKKINLIIKGSFIVPVKYKT